MPTAADSVVRSSIDDLAWLGRGSVVLAVLAVQVVAFVVTYVLEEPTLYALFALASAAALVAATGGGVRGVAATVLGTGVVAALGWWFGTYWILIAGPVVLTVSVGVTEARWVRAAAATLGTILLVALALPLAMFVARQKPSLVVEAALDPTVHKVLYLTVYAPLLASLIAIGFGVPLAYLLARGFPGQQFVEALVDLPLVVPHSVAGLLILFAFGRGAAFPDVPILSSLPGMLAAMTFVSAPYAVNLAREAFETVDYRLAYAARVHGATPWEVFRRVDFPLAMRGVLTGGVMAWARSVSEFGAVAVVAYNVRFFYPLAGERITGQHGPVYIFNVFEGGSLAESSAVAFLLLAMSVAIFLLVRWLGYSSATPHVT
ncbi:MAG: ABC transporter permease [Haloarculaceae archaeon]